MPEAAKPATPAEAIVVTPDSTFIRGCEEGERHLEVRRNCRMAKSQQMRWSRRGADRLLQVRCAVYNGTLGTGFGQRFQAANDPHPPAPIAA
jgi:hypothetical protein